MAINLSIFVDFFVEIFNEARKCPVVIATMSMIIRGLPEHMTLTLI